MTANPWLPAPLEVQTVLRETDDVVTLVLDASPRPFAFRPGQFTMLYRFGLGDVPISISGNPAEPDRLVHTVRGVGARTRPLLDLVPGDRLGARGPYGKGWPIEPLDGRDVLLVAGGIGLAPLRPVLYHLLADRARYGRIFLLYGARAPSDLLYLRQLHHWRGRFDLDVEVTVDRANEGWHGPVGVVTRLLERAPFDADDAAVLTCGPEAMMRFVVHEALQQGVPADRIWISMERSMPCGIGLCGHCQWGPDLVCRDGPVFRWDRVASRFAVQEL
ncbi:MAG: FAD/NAD(P)-binding protein [Myxococcota bacterium]